MCRSFCYILLQAAWIVSCAVAQLNQCGKKPDQREWTNSNKIVGGRNAEPLHYWPWQLSLQFLRENTTNSYGHTCGASLITETWALTAAHCVEARMVGLDDPRREDPNNFRLVLGTYSLFELQGSQIIGINRIVKHERWVPNPYIGYPNDIALLKLATPAQIAQPRVELACIPRDTFFNFTGSECWITGWGKMNWRDDFIPAILQEAKVEAISNERCTDLNFGYIRDSHICAGTGMPNACSGDSGGPMSCYKDGQWWQAGITSWGVVTCSIVPPVYTRISYFYEWIDYIVTQNP